MDAVSAQDQNVPLGCGAALRFEPFDSKHLGAPAYLLTGVVDAASLRGALAKLQDWLAAKPHFALLTARPADAEQEIQLARVGFHKVETSLTFGRILDASLSVQPDPRICLAQAADVADCIALGGRSFVTDRFHKETAIPESAADTIKADWVRNSLRGRADRAFVARDGGRAVGFNLCMVRGDTAWIDLIAVDSAYRRRGLARALVQAALLHYREQGFPRLHVKTQADNSASLALYRQCGFDLIERSAVYHLTPTQ